MTHVLLSFTSTLNALAHGALTEAELSEAVICFGCSRGWTCEESLPYVLDRQHSHHTMSEKVSVDTLATVRRHALVAESAGRAMWRKTSEAGRDRLTPPEAVEGLNRILARKGLPTIPDEYGLPRMSTDNDFFERWCISKDIKVLA